MPPQGTLSPNGEQPGGRAASGPFAVVFAAPQGKAAEVGELSVVFNRPLRALDANAEPPAIVLEPSLAGRWQWVGTHALHFVPEARKLAAATSFRVEVPGTTRALDGSTLGKPFRFEFATERPALVSSTPSAGSDGLTPAATFVLRFNQPIDPALARRAISFEVERAGKREARPFELRRTDPAETKKLELRPQKPLPVDSKFVLTIGKQLTGQEGPLNAGTDQRLEFRTYGPLLVSEVTCARERQGGKCAPGGGVGVSFSNPLPYKEAKRAISVTPALPIRWNAWSDESSMVSYVDVAAPFRAGTAYTLNVAGDVRDQYGQKLLRPHSEKLVIDDHRPTLEIGVQGDTLEPVQARPIPVGTVNVARYRLVAAKLRPGDLEAVFAERDENRRFDRVSALPGALRREVTPRAPRNQIDRHEVDTVAALGGAAERGPLALAVRFDRERGYGGGETFKVVKVTDLGITAKISKHRSLVWVTRLSNAAPVKDASVEFLLPGNQRRTYKTDDRGLAQIPDGELAASFDGSGLEGYVVVRSGADWTFEPLDKYFSSWRLSVPSNLYAEQQSYGMMFTERGVYRPGDTVQLKGIVRAQVPNGNAVPSARPLDIVVESSEGEEVTKKRVTTTRFGTFALSFQVPPSGRLGSWAVQAKEPGAKASVVYESFEVAEYRPAEFKVSVESDRPSYVRGATANWTLRGDYLFGAPMPGADASYTLTRAPTWFSVPESDGLVTDSSVYYADLDQSALTGGQLDAAEVKLDAQGTQRVTKKLELPAQRGPELVTLDAAVTDVARQQIASSSSAIVHPADFYVALRAPEDSFVTAPSSLAAGVLALSARGERLAGKKVRLELVQRRWTLARQDTGAESLRSITKVVDKVAASCDVVTAAAPVSCPLAVQESGYHVVRAVSADQLGNKPEAAFGLYALGDGSAGFGDHDTSTLDLVPNKKQYSVGDRARVLVKSPFAEAEALVTVERAGVYRAERVKLRGPTPTVEVPISEDLRPNAFVAVHLLRGRGPGGAAARTPAYRIGYAELAIDPEARRLKVDVRPSKRDLAPGEEVQVDVAVKDRAGAPQTAEVTVYAVDEGVLSLIGYKTPDPLPVFTAPRPLRVATLEGRDSLARITLEALDGALGGQKGAEGGGGGEMSARRDFRQTAYFNPAVLTDKDGKASVRFKLPESLTTYRVMAIAVTDRDHYGYGASSVTTSKRLMARPALPRFLRAGDQLEASVVLSAKDFGPVDATVTARFEGVVLEGPAERKLPLGRNQSLEARFPVRVERAGQAKLRFEVNGGRERDAVEVTRRIDAPAAFEAVALYGQTRGAEAQKLGDVSALRSDVGSLDVSVASSALVGLDASLSQLVDYPYGCTEQLSSRLLPLLPLGDLARDFGVALPKDVPGTVVRTVAEILSRQRGDGGFGMWPESPESFPWVSAYALWVLHDASTRGVAVPKSALDRGKRYLRGYLAEMALKPIELASAAFVVDVLAELGAADPGYMNRLFEQRAKLPLFAQALLLHALVVAKSPAEQSDRLVTEIEGQLRISGDSAFVAENTGDEYAVLMDSTTRTGALVLRALMAARPRHELGAKLARGLLSQRRTGGFRSTQEGAFALLALDAYRKAQESESPSFSARVWLGQTEILHADMRGRSLAAKPTQLSMQRVAQFPGAALTFDKQGSGTLFYSARLRYAPKTLPAAGLDQGFYVQKALRPVKPAELANAAKTIADAGVSRFAAGDLVLTDLVIVTPSPRDYVVLDDPLPAGFEAVDSRLATTAAWLSMPGSRGEGCEECDPEEAADARAHGSAYSSSDYRQEVRDDRVLFFVDHMPAGMYHYRYLARATSLGSFVVPPTRAEEMYVPENFGRTGAALVVVR